jgi:TM2 domain-containing membrane protein YozV
MDQEPKKEDYIKNYTKDFQEDEKPKKKRYLVPALLSFFIISGLGQVVKGEHSKGGIFIAFEIIFLSITTFLGLPPICYLLILCFRIYVIYDAYTIIPHNKYYESYE